MLIVNEETCVGCGWCQTFCPHDALTAWGSLKIDYKNAMNAGSVLFILHKNAVKVTKAKKSRLFHNGISFGLCRKSGKLDVADNR
ncbi:MAG: 4Fe-4S binding protein [Pseudomonadota bacterium]